MASLVPGQNKTIEEGAILPWNAGSRRLYQYAARELGVRLDVPYRELTAREKDIVLHGEPVQRRVTFASGRSGRPVQLNVTYENAIATVERGLRSDSEVSRPLAGRAPGRAASRPLSSPAASPRAGPARNRSARPGPEPARRVDATTWLL